VNFDRSVVIPRPPAAVFAFPADIQDQKLPCGLLFGPRKAESSASAVIRVLRKACVLLLAVRAPGRPAVTELATATRAGTRSPRVRHARRVHVGMTDCL